MTTEPPAVLDGRYRLGDLIGRGGMADVFRADDEKTGKSVAVKVLRVGEAADPQRFRSEMRILRRLRHEAIVRLIRAGTTTYDHPFFVMQLVNGQALSGLIRGEGPLDAETVAAIGARVASALDHAHSNGIVHRDIKPANILVDDDGRAYLTDFGVARLADATVVTHAGTTIGTAAYLAPEQVQDSGVGPAADVYSLGLVLLEALTGRRSFEGSGVESALARLAREPEIPANLPPPWPDLLRAMTRRSPDVRIDAAAVAGVLEGRLPPPAPEERPEGVDDDDPTIAPLPAASAGLPGSVATPTPLPPPEAGPGGPPTPTPTPVVLPASGPPTPTPTPAPPWGRASDPPTPTPGAAAHRATDAASQPQPAAGPAAAVVAAPSGEAAAPPTRPRARSRGVLLGAILGALAVLVTLLVAAVVNRPPRAEPGRVIMQPESVDEAAAAAREAIEGLNEDARLVLDGPFRDAMAAHDAGDSAGAVARIESILITVSEAFEQELISANDEAFLRATLVELRDALRTVQAGQT